jgi:hypothetical protein
MHKLVLVRAHGELALAQVRRDPGIAVVLLHLAALELDLRPRALLLALLQELGLRGGFGLLAPGDAFMPGQRSRDAFTRC